MKAARSLAAATFAAALSLSAAAPAAADWLALVVDRSGSIDDDELKLQRLAYADVLRDPEVADMLAETRVAIVEFDDLPEIVTGWTSAAEAARRYEGWKPVAPRGGTGIGRALGAALDLLEGKRGERVIDVSGDGRDNRDSLLLERLRAQAAREGVEINGLVLGGRAKYDIRGYYEDKVATGFVIPIARLADFRAALKRKILREMRLARR